MFDQNAFLISFLLANQQRDDLTQRGGKVPDDFVVRTAIVGGVTKNAGLAAMVMQNEASGLEPRISAAAQAEIDKVDAKYKEAVEVTWANFQKTFCPAQNGSVELKGSQVIITLPSDFADDLKNTKNPGAILMKMLRMHFDTRLQALLPEENCPTGK